MHNPQTQRLEPNITKLFWLLIHLFVLVPYHLKPPRPFERHCYLHSRLRCCAADRFALSKLSDANVFRSLMGCFCPTFFDSGIPENSSFKLNVTCKISSPQLTFSSNTLTLYQGMFKRSNAPACSNQGPHMVETSV